MGVLAPAPLAPEAVTPELICGATSVRWGAPRRAAKCMTVTLRLNTFSRPSLLLAAQHQGFLEEEGVALEVIFAKGSRAQMEGLLAGQWELAHTNVDNVMKFRGQGYDGLFVFLVADRGIGQKLVVHPDIKGWDDLRDRAVGVDAPDSGYAFVVYELLDRHGLPWGSYEVKPLGATSYRLDGLRSGAVVAGLLSHQYETSALDEGFTVIADTRDHFPELAGVTGATIRSWATDNDELLHGYTRALLAAARWTQDEANEDSLVELVARARRIPEAEAQRLLDLERAARTGGVPSADEAADSLRGFARLRGKATGMQPAECFNPRYMRAALEGARTGVTSR